MSQGATRCPSCGTVNRPEIKFCTSCGQPLVRPPQAARPGRGRHWGQRTWDALTMLGSAAVGAAWYAYSGLAETDPDLRSALTMALLPTALVLLRRPLDRLLLPLRSLRERIPRKVRLGIGLAVPFLVSNYLYASGSDEFDFMFKSVLVSTLASYVVLRNPAVPRPRG